MKRFEMKRRPYWCLMLGAAALALAGCSDPVTPPAQDAAADTALDVMAVDTTSPDTVSPDTMSPDTISPDTISPDTMSPDGPLPTCTDKVKNGAETDVDCGGGT